MVRISLPENASTGYRWTIERYYDEFLEALPAEAGYTSNSIGSGGDIAFMFCTRKAGTGQLVLNIGVTGKATHRSRSGFAFSSRSSDKGPIFGATPGRALRALLFGRLDHRGGKRVRYCNKCWRWQRRVKPGPGAMSAQCPDYSPKAVILRTSVDCPKVQAGDCRHCARLDHSALVPAALMIGHHLAISAFW
jgi:Chagasin family peptidase inhibitor I42